MTRPAASFALLIVFAIGVPERAAAVTGGTPIQDSSADGIVTIYDESAGNLCSGALIAPTVVLTAAHCLSDPMVSNYSVLGGWNPFQTALFTIGAADLHTHPAFNPNDQSHDVGVLILASAAPVPPLPWFATDEGYYASGMVVGMIGFGGTDPIGTGVGIRRVGSATISQLDAEMFLTDDTTGQGMCSGDSGGPALTTDEIIPSTIIGISSFGDQDCASFSAFQRTDANAQFIALFAPEPNAIAAAGAAIAALRWLARRRG